MVDEELSAEISKAVEQLNKTTPSRSPEQDRVDDMAAEVRSAAVEAAAGVIAAAERAAILLRRHAADVAKELLLQVNADLEAVRQRTVKNSADIAELEKRKQDKLS
jgi:hypothetical protein